MNDTQSIENNKASLDKWTNIS